MSPPKRERSISIYMPLLADETGRVIGGHLNEAKVSATCEIFIRRLEGEVERVLDPSIGLNVLDLPQA